MKVIAVFSIKGGVGKTATSVNLAYQASLEGGPTLLWDLDPQSASSFYFRVEEELKRGIEGILAKNKRFRKEIRGTNYPHLDLLMADESYRDLDRILDDLDKPKKVLRRVLQAAQDDYDYVFLDCPPGLGLVADNILRAADMVVVPVKPSPLSERTLHQLDAYCRKKELDVPLRPFFSMVDARKKLHAKTMAALGRRSDLLAARIPYSSTVENMGLRRAPVQIYAGWSDVARAYGDLWREIREDLHRE